MRVLYATDGSEQAQLAGQLIASIKWPAGSQVRVACAVHEGSVFAAAPFAPAMPASVDSDEVELLTESEHLVEEAVRGIAPSGVECERSAVIERPASAIVDEAAEWRADLIVMGSRGHGAIASMVLGSVSAEVVDHAPCPVLVVRQPRLTRAVLGQDGSSCASKAESIVAGWPIFERVAIEVVSVSARASAWPAALYAGNIGSYVGATDSTLDEEAAIANNSAQRLRQAGRAATCSVVEGSPATELIRIADDRAADLIVVGTRGRTGLRRLLVGSVARNVMQHAHCSVLIVR